MAENLGEAFDYLSVHLTIALLYLAVAVGIVLMANSRTLTRGQSQTGSFGLSDTFVEHLGIDASATVLCFTFLVIVGMRLTRPE